MQDMENKRILITGASGFIGGNLVREALERGYEVWAAIRKSSSLEHLQDTRVHIIYLSFQSQATLTEQLRELVSNMSGFQYVIHNAGVTKTLDKRDFFKVNAFFTRNLINALDKSGCKPAKFLLMSSLSAFGPVKEYSMTCIFDNDIQMPDSIYGRSKLAAEQFVKEQQSIPYIILRPTGVYGPGDKDYLVEIRSIKAGFVVKPGYRPQYLTFIYVKDLAKAVFIALQKQRVNKTYFVADGEIYTSKEYSDIIKKALGKRFVLRIAVPLALLKCVSVISELISVFTKRPSTLNSDKYLIMKRRDWTCDVIPLWNELGFSPDYDLKKGIAESIDWYRQNGKL